MVIKTTLLNQTVYAPHELEGVDLEKIPQHIGIIMDGNRRWAKQGRLQTLAGHSRGAESIEKVVRGCQALGIKTVTLFAFSTENWKRNQEEVDWLMRLLDKYLVDKRVSLVNSGIRLRTIGQTDSLPQFVKESLAETIKITQHGTSIDLVLALNYGSRDEIARAVRDLATRVKKGELDPQAIDEDLISNSLDTAGFGDPDLIIRTGGEQRLSNFLLWQSSYSELFTTPVFWPEFGTGDLIVAVKEYQRRERRFGNQ